MNKEQNITRKVAINLEPGLTLPNLEELSYKDLLDLFIIVARHYVQEVQNGGNIEQLDALQSNISSLRDEIHRKKN